MSAVLEKIIEEVRTLQPNELQILRTTLDEIAAEFRAFHVSEVKGKYANVLTSSDDFAARKAEEIELEDRRSQQ